MCLLVLHPFTSVPLYFFASYLRMALFLLLYDLYRQPLQDCSERRRCGSWWSGWTLPERPPSSTSSSSERSSPPSQLSVGVRQPDQKGFAYSERPWSCFFVWKVGCRIVLELVCFQIFLMTLKNLENNSCLLPSSKVKDDHTVVANCQVYWRGWVNVLSD